MTETERQTSGWDTAPGLLLTGALLVVVGVGMEGRPSLFVLSIAVVVMAAAVVASLARSKPDG